MQATPDKTGTLRTVGTKLYAMRSKGILKRREAKWLVTLEHSSDTFGQGIAPEDAMIYVLRALFD